VIKYFKEILMSQKIYTLTVSYEDNRNNKDIVTDAPGTLDDGLTYEQAALRKFISYIEQLEILQDPIDFHAKVVSVIAV
jgi:hypothetical protein